MPKKPSWVPALLVEPTQRLAQDERGISATAQMNSAPGSVIRLRIWRGSARSPDRPDAGDEATLLADLVGLPVRVELDRRVVAREADDQEP